MRIAVALAAGLLILPAPAFAADIRAVPGTNAVDVGQTFGISVKAKRGPSSRKVCLFTRTEGRWRKLAACERVSVGRTYKLRVRLGGAAVGRNTYLVAPASARPKSNPPTVRSNIFRIRVWK